MSGFLIFIAVVIVIIGVVRKANKLQQQQDQSGSENFPFPPVTDDRQMVDPWDFSTRSTEPVVDEIVVPEGESAAVVYSSIVMPQSVQGEIGNSAALSDGWENQSVGVAQTFDLKQAVIYSTILKPKFDDNIF